VSTLAATIARLAALADVEPEREAALAAFAQLKSELNAGRARAAEPDGGGGWRVNAWVKQGILLGFRLGSLDPHPSPPPFRFFDKDTLPTRDLRLADNVRVVPGGTAVRDGAYVSPGVIIMPPAYINIGAWVGPGTLVDSHALVGSCAQIGARVHLSAAAQIGGVLEPVGALPVILEDDVLVGGNCGVYEGAQVGAGAVLAAGVVLTRSTPVYDLPRETVHRATAESPLRIPPGAVVVPGARAVTRGPDWGLSLATPVIVKYRDARTAAAVELEDWLR
jgi:2,3,4,5-tetrahydropyridine-2-carboxylate N-succinyltransferase